MSRRVGDVVDVHDSLIGTDQIRGAARISGVRWIVDAVRLSHRVVDIAQQLERPLKLLGERTVRGDGVVARAEHDDIAGLKLADSITESVALDRSTRGVGFWIEPEQHVAPCELAQADASAIVCGNVEVRRVATNREQ